jgi:hypothetical protein
MCGIVARDGKCLFRRLCLFAACEDIQNTVRLCIKNYGIRIQD